MRGRRSLVVLALAAPMALSAVVMAPPASAAASFTSPTPAEGAVLSSNTFTVQASVAARSDTVTLTVTGRDASGATLCTSKTSGQGRLSSDTTLALTFPRSDCNMTRNAQWTATLTGDANASRRFATNASPATPGSFTADGEGARDVAFQWTRGSEPDLLGFALYDGDGGTIDGDVSLANCNGSTCTYALYYPTDNPGTHSYSIAARRSSAGCSSCGTEVLSGKASDSATLVEPPPPPPPSPTPTPTPTGGTTTGGTTGGTTTGGSTTGGSTTGGSTGGSTTGGSTTGGTTTGGTTGTGVQPAPKPTLPSLPSRLAAARRAFALNFNAFAPSLGIPKLPPLPATFAPTLSPEPQLPDGTFDPALPYKPEQETIEKTSVVQRAGEKIGVTDSADLATAIATALILLLMAAHLRRFLGAREEL